MKIDKYIFTCHNNIVSSNLSKKYSALHTIHIYKWQYKSRKQINIQNDYYTNTYLVLIRNILIKQYSNSRCGELVFLFSKK